MSTRKIKKDVLRILENDTLENIYLKFQQFNQKDLISPLFSAICRVEPSLRWHGITIFGPVVKKIFDDEPEAARIIMRRFLWSLNDESGGIGWGAPEAMAEIMCHSEELYREYSHMLFSYMREDGPEPFQDGNFLELPQLQSGLLWGIGRLALHHRKKLIGHGIEADVIKYLESENSDVRGNSAWCLGNLAAPGAQESLGLLANDKSEILLYFDGEFQSKLVADIAKEAIVKINKLNATQ